MALESAGLALLLKSLVDMLNGLQKSGITAERLELLSDRIAFVKEQLEVALQKVAALEKENAELTAEAAKLNEDLACYRVSEEFVERQGAMFRRDRSGRYSPEPICPGCRGMMVHRGSPRMKYACGNPQCGRRAGFNQGELQILLKELNGPS